MEVFNPVIFKETLSSIRNTIYAIIFFSFVVKFNYLISHRASSYFSYDIVGMTDLCWLLIGYH